jgi:hydroxymethylglutaryl-CoA synthase
VKHACLAGVYALKAAARYLATDGDDRVAIVVCGDIAEYERGSSGEPTQGAGAVAMLVEREGKLCSLELGRSGSASAYRGLDFRKPMARHFAEGYATSTARMHDFPIFNGKYSTACYVDEVIAALDRMFVRTGEPRRAYWDRIAALVMHRPYHHMPIQALAAALVVGMAREPAEHEAFAGLCVEAGQEPAAVRAELDVLPDLWALSERAGLDADPMPLTSAVVKKFRGGAWFQRFVADKLGFGSATAMEFGNLYSASLPAWLAAAFVDADLRNVDLAGRELLTIGYGSGDAAEAIPLRVAQGWRQAARRIGLADAVAGAVDLQREQYEALHDGREVATIVRGPRFAITEVGTRMAAPQDLGVERYDLLR